MARDQSWSVYSKQYLYSRDPQPGDATLLREFLAGRRSSASLTVAQRERLHQRVLDAALRAQGAVRAVA